MLTSSSMAISTAEIELQPKIVVWVVNKLRHAWIEKGGGEHGMQITTRQELYPGGIQVVFMIHNSRKGTDYASHN